VSRLEGGCVIYKGQSEAVIYARYLPGSVRSRVIYRGSPKSRYLPGALSEAAVIYGDCLRSGANLGSSAPLRPPWGPMRDCGGPMGPHGGLWGPHEGLWGPHGAPWGAVWAVWGTQLLHSFSCDVFARIFVIMSIFAFSADFTNFHDFLATKLSTPILAERVGCANPWARPLSRLCLDVLAE